MEAEKEKEKENDNAPVRSRPCLGKFGLFFFFFSWSLGVVAVQFSEPLFTGETGMETGVAWEKREEARL